MPAIRFPCQTPATNFKDFATPQLRSLPTSILPASEKTVLITQGKSRSQTLSKTDVYRVLLVNRNVKPPKKKQPNRPGERHVILELHILAANLEACITEINLNDTVLEQQIYIGDEREDIQACMITRMVKPAVLFWGSPYSWQGRGHVYKQHLVSRKGIFRTNTAPLCS